MPYRMVAIAVAALVWGASACDTQTTPKEVSPEHQACMDKVETYLTCVEGQAAELPGAAAKQMKRSTEANRRKSTFSLDKCESVLASASEPSCLP